MNSILLAGRSYKYGAGLNKYRLSSSIVRFSRAASLNSAIGRGLRKSKGVGFRGKERSLERREHGFNKGSWESKNVVRRTADPPLSIPKGRLTRDAWKKDNDPFRRESRDEPRSNSSTPGSWSGGRNTSDGQRLPHTSSRYDRREESRPTGSSLRLRRGKRDIAENEKSPKPRSRAGRFNDPNYSFGLRALERRAARKVRMEDQGDNWDPLTQKPRSDGASEVTDGFRKPTTTSAASAAWRAAESDRMALERNPSGSRLSKGRQAYLSRVAETSQRKTSEESLGRPGSTSAEESQGYVHREKDWIRASTGGWPSRESIASRNSNEIRSTSPRVVNDRLPLSIPYTTPASEFLYGTSVVEAALRSRREPRRKVYKLYIYKGENREFGDRQDAVERLAKKNNVPIVYHTETPRLLDKMSAGRPHNGYILEASPLPKLPVASLGSLAADGFDVNLDHQSREEAAINGTSPFHPIPESRNGWGRKPLILFLDSILDPGNLGGIIRTASFLGITAIALSTRNSAPLSPVVLKASAGASENVTLFSVNKPAGFITDSKRAGWKVYAAVAPRNLSAHGPPRDHLEGDMPSRRSTSPNSNVHPTSSIPAVTTDDLLLSSPLSHDPCILMLGNEGEGLRWNLRSKADAELSIAGSAHRGGVDSLNVSVAAGILCQAFLSRVGSVGRKEVETEGSRGEEGLEEETGKRPIEEDERSKIVLEEVEEEAQEKAEDLF